MFETETTGGAEPADPLADERGRRRRGWLGLLAVVAAWCVAVAWGSGKGYYPCYDSGAYVTVARAWLAGEGYVEGNHPEKPPFILYPPGYVLPLAGGMALFGEDWRALRLATVAPFGLVALLLIPWAFGRRLAPEAWPLAGALLGLGGVYLWTLRIQAEIPYLLWAMLSVGFLDRAFARGRVVTREAGLAALFGVLAIWTKPMGLILPVAAGFEAARLAVVRFRAADPARGVASRLRCAATAPALAALFGVLVLVPFAVHLAQVQPDALDPSRTHVLQKDWWNPDAGQRSFLSLDNGRRLVREGWDALRYYVPWSLLTRHENTWSAAKNRVVALVGWMVLLGLARRLLRREWDGFDWLVLGQAGLICSMPNQHPRYYTVVAPALVVSFLGGLAAVGEAARWVLGRLAPAAAPRAVPAALLLGSLPLLAHDLRDVRGYRAWGEAWSDQSLNVYIAIAAAARAQPGDVLLVDDHYGTHAVTGLPALSYHPAQRKSMTGWNAEEYLARGGRVDVVAAQPSEWEMARELFERHGWVAVAVERHESDWYLTARLVRREVAEEMGWDREAEPELDPDLDPFLGNGMGEADGP